LLRSKAENEQVRKTSKLVLVSGSRGIRQTVFHFMQEKSKLFDSLLAEIKLTRGKRLKSEQEV